jgi:hypothetical protein
MSASGTSWAHTAEVDASAIAATMSGIRMVILLVRRGWPCAIFVKAVV